MIDATGAIVRGKPFRDDTFAAERTSVLEDDGAVTGEMLIVGDAVLDATQQMGERRLATLQRLAAKVLTVQLDQIEGAQHGGMIVKAPAESVEYREAALIDHDGLAVYVA